MITDKPRINYIDFMKGLCIILIVGYHITPENIYGNANHMLMSFRVPMYYFLSGFFFKPYNGFLDFTRRKVNNIIVPLAFFYLTACALAIISCEVFHLDRMELIGDKWQWEYLLDPILLNDFHYSNALWFLISLFEVNIIYYFLNEHLNNLSKHIAIIAISIFGWYIGSNNHMLPMQLDTAMLSLPYFVLGNAVKNIGSLAPNSKDRWGLAIFPIVLFVLYFVAPEIGIHDRILPNYVMLYLVPFVAILSLFWFCKNLPKVPVINYIGRYSLIVLGTQHNFRVNPLSSFQTYWRIVWQLLGGVGCSDCSRTHNYTHNDKVVPKIHRSRRTY